LIYVSLYQIIPIFACGIQKESIWEFRIIFT